MESRPTRWHNAVRRANEAVYELAELRDQLIAVRDEIEERWTRERTKLENALRELIELQSEYASLGVPDNLSDSRTQEKLYRVADFNFEKMLGSAPDMTVIFQPLDDFNPSEDDTFVELYDAERVALPKFYGRD
jgi:hypothetical protein